MNNFLFLAIAFFSIQFISAQEQISHSQKEIYQIDNVEVKPEYPGGVNEFYEFISENFKTPSVNGLIGEIYLSFVINRDGTIDEVKILRDIGYGTGEEVIRVLGICPKWKSGEQNGKKVSYKYFLPILIKGINVSCLPISVNATQETTKVLNDKIYNTSGIDVRPDFPGGMGEFYKFIGKNYRTPRVQGLAGKVYISFVIEKDGSIENVKILRDIGYGTGEEAVRVLKDSPKWSPGEQNGQKVRVLYSLPITINTK